MNNLQIPYNQYFKKECRPAAEAGFRFISLNLHETEEDTLCARYIKALLEGERLDMDKEIDALRLTSGAKFFDPKQNDTFPRADFDLCTRLDCFDFAKVTRIIRTCLKAVNCGAFCPFTASRR